MSRDRTYDHGVHTPEFAALVARFEASGMTQVRFAKEHGLPVTTFHGRLKKFRDRQAAAARQALPVRPAVHFVELEAARATGAATTAPCRIVLAGGALVIETTHLPPADYLAELVRRVHAPC